MNKLLIILVLLTGCITPITKLDDLPKNQLVHKQNRTLDSFKKYYFTPEAYEAIKDIGVYKGFAGQAAQVWGINIWTDILSIFTGVGLGRKITTNGGPGEWYNGLAILVHEYIHQLDDMDRDGDAEFIDHEEWKQAYIKLSKDKRYRGIVIFTENNSNGWFTNTFGVGEYAEHIAYSGAIAFWHGGPEYFLNVYRKILRINRRQRYETSRTK